jgi:peptide/nickel transport system substrate-binding protein
MAERSAPRIAQREDRHSAAKEGFEMRRGLLVLLLAGVAATAWTAVGSGAGTKTASGSSVTIANVAGMSWTCNFNPFNSTVQFLTFGPLYEELVFVNELKSGAPTPWLASKFAWSNHAKTLTFTIRKGVKWSDGKPLTAADVLFTFQMLKKHKALDLQAVWSVLKSVSRKGSDQVVFTFKSAAAPYFYYVAGQTPIVPKHIWAKISNPVKYADMTPVGSGPYTVGNCNPQRIIYTKNAHYWQKGKPKIDTVVYPAYTDNPPANLDLATGQDQWGGQFIPQIKTYYSAKSKDNHYWFPPVANVSIFINLKNPILKSLPVRRAMAYAINRPHVAKLGESGYEPPGNQTGIVSPTFKSWVNKKLAKQVTYDPKKAKQILTKAGFKLKGGVFQTKSGKPLSFTMINISGYDDWIASASIVQQELKQIGIKVTTSNISGGTYDSDTFSGHFQLAYDGDEAGGPSPYYELRQELYSKNSAPIGQQASSNWERYYNKSVDKLIESYAKTTSLSKQHSIVNQLEAAMVRDVPIIPITEGVDFYEYNTKSITGWVTPGNPYAKPSPYEVPDWGVVLTHLRPKG